MHPSSARRFTLLIPAWDVDCLLRESEVKGCPASVSSEGGGRSGQEALATRRERPRMDWRSDQRASLVGSGNEVDMNHPMIDKQRRKKKRKRSYLYHRGQAGEARQ